MQSIWEKDFIMPAREALRADIRRDACVIGAGIAGINCAHRLRRAGLRVAVLEARRVGGGTTARTTGKITAQHGLIYDYLRRSFDEGAASLYARANQAAIEEYASIIAARKIDCDFVRADHSVYALAAENPLSEEYAAMRTAGLAPSLTDRTELPFAVAAALRLPDQAHFHPLKYVRALAEGLEVYEGSRVLSVEDGVARTAQGSVAAAHIIVATHFPFINAPGYYFLRMHQERSLVAALADAPALAGMYIDHADGGLSLRPQCGALLLGSGSFRTGENAGGEFSALREKARACYPGARAFATWSSQDCMPQDRLPYIGRYGASTPNLYVATGFGKWGMSGSMVAAMLLTDQILGVPNEAAALFSPQRSPVRGLNELAGNMQETAKGFARHLKPPEEILAGIEAGKAGIVEYRGRKLGAYRDEADRVHLVSLACPHLGCALAWNQDDLSWDCPCHGSRFDVDGNLLDGPAQHDLRVEWEEA